MRTVITLITLLLSWQAYAGTATLTSIAPTQNVDNSGITDTPMTICYHERQAGGTYDLAARDTCVADVAPGAETSYVFTLPAGEWFFVGTAIDASGDQSAVSNEVMKTIVDTVPIPPGGIAVAGATAYIIIQSENAFTLLPIGTVSADTQCSPTVGAVDDNGVTAHKIPTSAVTPYNAGQELILTFASCDG